MTISARKLLVAEAKADTVIATYVSGAAVAPAAGAVAIYTDIVAAQRHRKVEIQERLKDLINRAREEDYRRPSSTICYWRVPLLSSKDDIAFTTVSTEIVAGDVAIGIGGTVRSGGLGSIILDACWKEIIDWTRELDRLTV